VAGEPVTQGEMTEVSPLTFRCTGCGNCCRTLRVAVTALDVGRLAQATG
jgi:Fe-S-cluster containining protein